MTTIMLTSLYYYEMFKTPCFQSNTPNASWGTALKFLLHLVNRKDSCLKNSKFGIVSNHKNIFQTNLLTKWFGAKTGIGSFWNNSLKSWSLQLI